MNKHLRISSFQRGFVAFDERDGSVQESTQYPSDGLLGIAVPIYWGSEWDPARPKLAGQSWQDIDGTLGRMITDGICDGLRSYGVTAVAKADPTRLNEPVPPRFFDALPFGSNPATDPTKGFTDKDLTDRITRAVTAQHAPWPSHEEIEPEHLPPPTSRLSCYLVFLPQGCHFTDNPWGEGGHHSAFEFQAPNWEDKPDVRFAWIGQDATIDSTMETAVHELVEAFQRRRRPRNRRPLQGGRQARKRHRRRIRRNPRGRQLPLLLVELPQPLHRATCGRPQRHSNSPCSSGIIGRRAHLRIGRLASVGASARALPKSRKRRS